MGSLRRAWVENWAGEYVTQEMPRTGGRERRLLHTVGPAVAARGHLAARELLEIGRWKSARTLPLLRTNPEAEVRAVSTLAFAPTTPDHLRHHVLTALSGVGAPMASAILTVWNPDRFTVTDYRARGALWKLDARGVFSIATPRVPQPNLLDYPMLLATVLRLRNTIGRTIQLRDLDRALWEWHKQGMPSPP